MSRPLRICFVAPAGYPVLAADRSVHFVGGSEVQQSFIAPELARRGYDVSMISMDYGQPEGDRVNGVRLLKMHAPDAGLPVLRFFHPRLTSLWSAMHRAEADFYYQMNAGPLTGFVARFARSKGRRMIYVAASDADFDPMLPFIRHKRDKAIYRYGVRNAHHVVAQSDRQVRMCQQAFGRDSTRINSCYHYKGAPGEQGGPIIWVATVKPLKRPELFLDLAQRLPQYNFRMIGGAAAGASHFESLQCRAKLLTNIEMTGFVPYADVDAYFDRASLLINTSKIEGFPNTFMQAWSRGIPTVSFFDAGARLNGMEVGTSVVDIDAMEHAVRAFKSGSATWHKQSMCVTEHFGRNYTVNKAVDELERIIREPTVKPNPLPD